MITSKDILDHQKGQAQGYNDTIDAWLVANVQGQYIACMGLEVPEEVPLKFLVSSLESRGFSVTSYSGHQGTYVYLNIEGDG